MKAEAFLAAHPVFSRAELAAVLHHQKRADATIDSHLKRWRRLSRVARVKPGVFVRLDAASAADHVEPDYIALASRMAPDAVVGYHTALEAHGVAQSLFERLTFVTWTKAKSTSFRGRRFVPVRPRASLIAARRGEPWVERMDRAGLEIHVTTIERTVADVLDRPDLAGGIEETWRSISAVPALDTTALEQYVAALGSATLAARVGFFLEQRREELVVPDTVLDRLRKRIPRAPVFMDRRLKGHLVATWALIVPDAIVADDWGGDA